MKFVFRYFKDDYGLDTTIGITVFAFCCFAVLLFSCPALLLCFLITMNIVH